MKATTENFRIFTRNNPWENLSQENIEGDESNNRKFSDLIFTKKNPWENLSQENIEGDEMVGTPRSDHVQEIDIIGSFHKKIHFCLTESRISRDRSLISNSWASNRKLKIICLDFAGILSLFLLEPHFEAQGLIRKWSFLQNTHWKTYSPHRRF